MSIVAGDTSGFVEVRWVHLDGRRSLFGCWLHMDWARNLICCNFTCSVQSWSCVHMAWLITLFHIQMATMRHYEARHRGWVSEYSRKKRVSQLIPRPRWQVVRTRHLLSSWTEAVFKSVDHMRGRVQSAIHAGLWNQYEQDCCDVEHFSRWVDL